MGTFFSRRRLIMSGALAPIPTFNVSAAVTTAKRHFLYNYTSGTFTPHNMYHNWDVSTSTPSADVTMRALSITATGLTGPTEVYLEGWWDAGFPPEMVYANGFWSPLIGVIGGPTVVAEFPAVRGQVATMMKTVFATFRDVQTGNWINPDSCSILMEYVLHL